jgi:N-acetyl sugar amidotransferase
MIYCSKCILPSTRPSLVIDSEGICSACRNFEFRPSINWSERKELFAQVVTEAKKKSKGYDCLIPVSGGKDSTWQVLKCLEYGLNPLCVTWKPIGRTKIGQQNLDNLISLGVDHIDYSINPNIEKKFMLSSLKEYGSTAVPMHMAIFNIPLKIALKFSIPLVIWGENSAFEYGDNSDASKGFRLDSEWFKKYGVTHGTSAKDWVGKGFTEKEMTPYYGPNHDELEKRGVHAIFLGYYFEWDTQMTYQTAKEHGFNCNIGGARTGTYNFADIDDHYISIHHFLKWYKFGFTRSFDNLSLEIRNGRISRLEAIDVIDKEKTLVPEQDIENFCNLLSISKENFFQIIEKFRNKKIWTKKNNLWKIENFIVPHFGWSK